MTRIIAMLYVLKLIEFPTQNATIVIYYSTIK